MPIGECLSKQAGLWKSIRLGRNCKPFISHPKKKSHFPKLILVDLGRV